MISEQVRTERSLQTAMQLECNRFGTNRNRIALRASTSVMMLEAVRFVSSNLYSLFTIPVNGVLPKQRNGLAITHQLHNIYSVPARVLQQAGFNFYKIIPALARLGM